MKDDKYKNLMKLNWFKKEWNYYNRDDWLQINCSAWMWNLVYPDGMVVYCTTREQMVWELVLRNIINRFYF